MRYRISYLLLFLLACSGQLAGQGYENGLVVSAHPEASQVGLEILQDGGNAVDASVAVQFALAVVYPSAGNLGGGGFMVFRQADGATASLDFRERAPGKAHRDLYLNEKGEVVPGLSIRGHLAAGVPGTVAGMVEAHEKYGKLSWNEVLRPAIRLALGGFPITGAQAAGLNGHQDLFRKYNPGSAYFLKEKWKAGDTLVQEDLGHTLERIRDKGIAGFYKGRTARLIVREMKEGGGIISRSDLKNYKAVWREPVTGMYKDYKVISMPPPSSGGVALLQMLKMAAPYEPGAFHNAPQVHLLAEIERRVFADRAAYLGDPDFYEVPVEKLLDEDYLRQRMESFEAGKASPSSEITAGKLAAANALQAESMETTHFSIVDKEGNAVALTTTLNGSYGCQVVVDGAGFLLNNEMDDFSAKPGVPNMFGLVGGEANAIEPGKRMLSSMTPTILEKGGRLFMMVGSPGGSTIITTVFQTILNVVDYGMTISEAVDAKRFHHQWLPDQILAERDAFDEAVMQGLEKKGHQLKFTGSIGRCDAILVKDGKYYGGADRRGDDTAAGY
ncbi:gamma-glutamyltranspeptidase/glutathione hydrolase [Anseongella ginsenosidimutans]|uniref:Glutathione hydrolase proenzyme n=1 Tax=Anseongella ginsenosidimutans TaxID=496056 RepID=A0A4V2UTM9_9SPHI|nr:gamma-glutamyltransferase [Anseongella ginsenosidimutans]TCS86812.1 gamma-glutamyltranspeptidase/glutathione hydrolase [Anseongella ginsenosidimutans]